MEARSSVLVDKSLYPKRNGSSVPGFNGSGSSNNFLLGPASQRFLNNRGCGGAAWSLGPHPLPYSSYRQPTPTYSSLPNASLLQHPYPPLLPLPMAKSLSLPSSSPVTSRMAGPATVHSANKDQKKPRSSPANPKKDPQRGAARPQKVPSAARAPKSTAANPACKDEKPEVEGNSTDDVYALSPPPSSLPMPKFSLRARTPSPLPSTTCNAEAFGGRSAQLAGADAGASASADLRRLLRL